MFRRKIKILVHSGRFHADEVFAVAALKRYLKKEKVVVTRDRNIDTYEDFDFVLDIGGIYSHERKMYDHHQTGGAGERDSGVPYATFGLIWKHYGPLICDSAEVANAVDEKIVQPIDASDVGYDMCKRDNSELRTYDLDLMIHSFHPVKGSNEDWDAMFEKALNIAELILEREILKAEVKVNDMQKVMEVYENTEDKRILIFEEPKSFGNVLDDIPEPIYSISPEVDGLSWKIYAIPVKGNDPYVHRKSFPESWRGLKPEDLQKETGIEDVTFCHNGGFLCATKTKEGAIQLAKKSLEY